MVYPEKKNHHHRHNHNHHHNHHHSHQRRCCWVSPNPNPNPNSGGDDDECLDTEGKFIYLIKKNGKKKKTTCEKVGKKKKLCGTKYKGDDENLKGETLSKLCPVACKLC
mmetsp:Transcript_26589/g.30399  ORF Transcript_26589/g.30399 Transcript_26589/m.30399 type:complete len:109 (+) Transcript_26589:37-363(+)